MTITFRQGVVCLLYVPFDTVLTDDQKVQIDRILFEHNFNAPRWDAYDEMFEGFILDDDTDEIEYLDLTNDDDHMESYFTITETFSEVTERIRSATLLQDIIVCSGNTGYCVLELTC